MDSVQMISLHTTDIAAENAAKLARLFPDIVTEVLDEDGNVRRSIDVEALKAHVGDIAEDKRERYQFTWPGKQRARAEAIRPIDKTMRPCPEESVNWDATENLYIEGDNLDALKLLRSAYAGRVKLVLIDPPYNTGHDFLYNDNFSRTEQEEIAYSSAFDEEFNVLDSSYRINSEANGRFHSDWCSMMYPRLMLARDLLSKDGTIFICIDENEVENLKKICNEVFGKGNFLNSIAWRYTSGGVPEEGRFSAKHDTILVYAKSRDASSLNIPFEKSYSKTIPEPHTESGKRLGVKRDSVCEVCGGAPGGKYREVVMRDVWTDINSLFRNNEEKKMLEDMGVSFNSQKPVKLFDRIISAGSNPGDIVLDFFSGSGTTAAAVMQMNAANYEGRSYILVQIPELSGDQEGSGYDSICEIAKERIRRVGKKIVDELESSEKVPDIGFRVLKIDSTNFEDVQRTPDSLFQDALFSLADNVKPGRAAEDILFQLFPQLEIPYTARIDKLDICGKTVYSVDDGMLLACFDREVPEDVIRAMAEREPSYAVLRDASFVSDDALANFEEIFKTVSPETTTRVV